MKKCILAICLFLGICAANAQEKVKEVVSDKYDRNSVSYIFVERHQHPDVVEFYKSFSISKKFDVNDIETKVLEVNCPNPHAAATEADVKKAVNESNIGKEIISYVFNRKEDGSFDDKIILERGRYNAKDQDIKNLEAAKVKELAWEWGEPLVNSAYIVIYDVYNTDISRDKKGNITYKAHACANVFKLKANRDILDEFYSTAWADASSTAEEKAKASEAYNDMKFEFKYVTSVTSFGLSMDTKYKKGSIYEACVSAYEDVFRNLENKIDAWQVKTYVTSVKPLAAKIGTKEGLKNGCRYQAYSYAEDKNGELKSVKRGMARATVIANNSTVATGNSKESLFYQISGFKNIEEGYVLRQKNDIKLGIGLTAGLSAIGFRAGLDCDYILHIGKRGAITYAMLNAGYNIGEVSGEPAVEVDGMIGLGYGIPLTRFFEITPYAMFGGFYNIHTEKISTYIAEPGVRLAATLQPWSIFINAGAQVLFGEYVGYGPSVKFGIKRTF